MKYCRIEWSNCKQFSKTITSTKPLTLEELENISEQSECVNNTTIGMVVKEAPSCLYVAQTVTYEQNQPQFLNVIVIEKASIVKVEELSLSNNETTSVDNSTISKYENEISNLKQSLSDYKLKSTRYKEQYEELLSKVNDYIEKYNNAKQESVNVSNILQSVSNVDTTNTAKTERDQIIEQLSKKYNVRVDQLINEYPKLTIKQLRTLHRVPTWSIFSNLLTDLDNAGLIERRTRNTQKLSMESINEAEFISDYNLYSLIDLKKKYGSDIKDYIDVLVAEDKIKAHPKDVGDWKVLPDYLTDEQLKSIIDVYNVKQSTISTIKYITQNLNRTERQASKLIYEMQLKHLLPQKKSFSTPVNYTPHNNGLQFNKIVSKPSDFDPVQQQIIKLYNQGHQVSSISNILKLDQNSVSEIIRSLILNHKIKKRTCVNGRYVFTDNNKPNTYHQNTTNYQQKSITTVVKPQATVKQQTTVTNPLNKQSNSFNNGISPHKELKYDDKYIYSMPGLGGSIKFKPPIDKQQFLNDLQTMTDEQISTKHGRAISVIRKLREYITKEVVNA